MRSIQRHTTTARQHIAGDIVAAVPAFGDEYSEAASKVNAFAGWLSLAIWITPIITLIAGISIAGINIADLNPLYAVAVILFLNRIAVRLVDSSNDATRDEVLFVVRPDRVDVISGTAKNPGSVLESHPVDAIRLWRPDDEMSGRIAVSESEWGIAPWHEKQILRTLAPLGVDLSGMPQAAIDNLALPQQQLPPLGGSPAGEEHT